MPKTQREHANAIRDAINAAIADGFETDILNECCGCSSMTLEIAPHEAELFGGEQDIVIMGDRRHG